MACRTSKALIPLLILLGGCADASGSQLERGGTLPQNIAPADAVVVGWSFSSRDYLSCQTAAPLLRRVKQVYGSRVRVVAITDPGGDPALLESFFRSERIPVDTVIADARDYGRMSVSGSPVLFVAKAGRVVEAWEGQGLRDHLSGDFSNTVDLVGTELERHPL